MSARVLNDGSRPLLFELPDAKPQIVGMFKTLLMADFFLSSWFEFLKCLAVEFVWSGLVRAKP